MATSLAKQNKMKRTESRKSHSWWWDSHISPKNKWLQENLEVMDGYVKRMLKLIEEDADSFAKKAEMYYKKRPELINLVEDFYRMYRALAERYDIVSGELRKRVPSDLQSQSSGFSDTNSDHASTLPSSDQHIERRSSGPRAAGFDIFLGGGGNKSQQPNKEGDESSSSDSECQSDDSSVINYAAIQGSDEEQGLRRRITELEAEISEVKEKYRLLEEENRKGSHDESETENAEALLARLAGYEEQLNVSREKIRLSEEEINKLKDEVQKYQSLEYSSVKQGDSDHLEGNKEKVIELQESNGISEVLADKEHQIRMLEEELKITKEKFLASETQVENLKQKLESSELSIHHLQDQLGSVENDVSVWKTKLEEEKKEVSELQDRIVKYESDLSDRDQEIKGLKEAISNANKTLSEENSRLQTDMDQLLKEKLRLENNLKEIDFHCQSLQKDVSRLKTEKEEVKVGIDEKNNRIEDLSRNLDALKVTYEALLTEKKAVDTKITVYIAEIGAQKNQIVEMNKHLNQLHMEHVELIVAAEGARKHAQELRSSAKELEQELEKQKEVILQGAEEKREAIRQLCLSVEYYRNGYHRLRQAVIEHRRLPVMAS